MTLCKDCKWQIAVWFAHGLDEDCDDEECIEAKHGAQCQMCLNEFLRLHTEIDERFN